MTSEDRHRARRARREKKREARKFLRGLLYDDFDRVFTYRNMYRAYAEIRKGVMWKPAMQRYSATASICIQKALQKLRDGKWKSHGFHEFSIRERGKTRHIQSVNNEERNIQRCLCDRSLVPLMEAGFSDDNVATRKGKGYHYAIRRIRKKLAHHIRKHGVHGWVLIFDFRNFFGSIRHDVAKRLISERMQDERLKRLLWHLIDCFGEVGLGLGSQISQTIALAYGSRIDHMIQERFQIGAYLRYMDDGIVISESKAKLKRVLAAIREEAEKIGLAMNPQKSRIIRLRHGFTILKKRFLFTKTGKIVMKICRKSIQRERQRLRKLVRKARQGKMQYTECYHSLQSWRSYAECGNAHRTIRQMERYYTELLFSPSEAAEEYAMC